MSSTNQKVERVLHNAPESVRNARGSRTSGLRSSRSTSIWLVAVVWFLAFPLHAHDIYSSWAETQLLADRLDLTLTLARSSASRLLPNPDTLPPLTPENFAASAPRLKAIAPELFEITSAGKALKLTSAEVKISGDADITFHLVYPRPSAGTLRFVANYLFHLVDGHVGTLVLNDASGKDLGWSPVSVDQPVFQIALRDGNGAPSKKEKPQ